MPFLCAHCETNLPMGYRHCSQPAHKWRLHSGQVTSQTEKEQGVRRWGKRQTLGAVAVAVVIGGVGGAAVYAATAGALHADPLFTRAFRMVEESTTTLLPLVIAIAAGLIPPPGRRGSLPFVV